jgi:hypothetical protein
LQIPKNHPSKITRSCSYAREIREWEGGSSKVEGGLELKSGKVEEGEVGSSKVEVGRVKRVEMFKR